MPNTIDATGFTRVRFQDLREEKAQEYKDGFSNQSLKTDVQSGVGQEVSISTFAEDDLAAFFEVVLDALNPLGNQGVLLDRSAIIMNKRRQDEVRSSVILTVTADGSGATVTSGFQVSDLDGSVFFETQEELVLAPNTSGDVEAWAVEAGAIEAPASTLIVIKTPIFGVLSVINNNDASIGRARESDGSLRARSLGSSSSSSPTVEGINTALSDIDGVTKYWTEENNTTSTNALGMPAKSVFPIVEGGSDSDIAKALITGGVAAGIAYTEAADIPAANIVSDTYTSPVNSQVFTAHWARPDGVRIYIDVVLNKLSNYPADGDDRVKQNISDWIAENLNFGDDLYASQLYSPIQEVEGAIVISVDVDTSSPPSGNSVAIEIYQEAEADTADITIT